MGVRTIKELDLGKALKFVIAIICCLIFLIAFYIFFLWATYIDNTVTSGHAYGFNIGDTKKETYYKARNKFRGDQVYVLHPIRETGYGPHLEFNFSEKKFPILSGRERWSIYMDDGFFNVYVLKFHDEILTEIYRHRKYFALE